MRNYHISNIFNVKTPQNDTSCRVIINDLLSKMDMYVDSERWKEIVEKTEQWITHQWECDRISYDAQQESIEKVYRKLSA